MAFLMKQPDYCIIYTTFPDLRTAKKILKSMIQHKFAACGNIFKLSSLYIWKGKIEDTLEYGAFIKTIKKKYKKCEDFILHNHPYEVPEIISWNVENGFSKYLDWIQRAVSK
jgi:periplasmic divalent cation tolerance protein